MKWFVPTVIVIAIICRIVTWKSTRDDSMRLCSILDAKQIESLTIEGVMNPTNNHLLDITAVRSIYDNIGVMHQFSGRIVISVSGQSPRELARPFLGRMVAVSGAFQCRLMHRNPSQKQDGLWHFQSPVLTVAVSTSKTRVIEAGIPLLWRVRLSFWKFLAQTFGDHHTVFGLIQAVWVGDMVGLPLGLTYYYKNAGLLPVLALSGQHVICLSLLARYFTQILARLCFLWPSFRWLGGYRQCMRFLPVGCSLLLCITSPANPPIQRTFVTAISLYLLRCRCLECSYAQVCFSCAACFIAWDPSFLTSMSFVLSMLATVILACGFRVNPVIPPLKQYLLTSLIMPILVLPVSAFYFSRIPLAAPFYALLFGWIWEMMLIPAAFLLPAIALLPQTIRHDLLCLIENTLTFFFDRHLAFFQWLTPFSVTTLRLTVCETLLLTTLMLILIVRFRRGVAADI